MRKSNKHSASAADLLNAADQINPASLLNTADASSPASPANQTSLVNAAFQTTWQGKAILLVDLDAFFASVEQLDHPKWRGKPVIVGGQAKRRGVVSTASYEARAYGVHSAMPSVTAEKLCPNAIWTTTHFERYHEVSAQVMQILKDESPLLEQMSIDEAYLDVSPGKFCKQDPIEIAMRIQQRVSELGVTCSIGIGSGKCIAKIASDLDKPKGLSVIFPGSEASFLAPLPVRKMPGIGKQSEAKLKSYGIETLGNLAKAELSILKPIFGINAAAMKERARGIDNREINTDTEIKSVSHERTFAQDLTSRTEIEMAIDFLSSLVARRLRNHGLAGKTVTLKLRYADLSIRNAQKTMSHCVDEEAAFIPVAKSLIDEIWRPGDKVRLVGVGISGFDKENDQVSLFNDEHLAGQQLEGKENPTLIHAADKVRDKFGDDMLKFGREFKISLQGTGLHADEDINSEKDADEHP